MRSPVQIADGDPGKYCVEKNDCAVRDVFSENNLTKIDRGSVEELDPPAVAAKAVVHQIREHQEGVCRSTRKSHIRRAVQSPGMTWIQGSHAEHEQHKNRHDQT